MENDPEDEVLVRVDLDEETMAHYERRAEAAGLTIEKQLRYELEVNHGFTLPDPGDGEATRRSQLFQRIYQEFILRGCDVGGAMNSKQFRHPADGYTRTTRVGGRIFGGRGFRLMSKIGPVDQRNVYARIYRPRGGRPPYGRCGLAYSPAYVCLAAGNEWPN